jgi:hypothetical protein
VLPKSGIRFSAKITRATKIQRVIPEKWEPVFGQDHAQNENSERDDDSKEIIPL